MAYTFNGSHTQKLDYLMIFYAKVTDIDESYYLGQQRCVIVVVCLSVSNFVQKLPNGFV